MVKHVVKPLLQRILRESRVPKKSMFTRAFLQCFQGLSRFCFLVRSALLPAGASPPVSCSQTSRATNCATPRYSNLLTNSEACVTISFHNRWLLPDTFALLTSCAVDFALSKPHSILDLFTCCAASLIFALHNYSKVKNFCQ